jgi:hypothetical protein
VDVEAVPVVVPAVVEVEAGDSNDVLMAFTPTTGR